jgi:hypothetical protein
MSVWPLKSVVALLCPLRIPFVNPCGWTGRIGAGAVALNAKLISEPASAAFQLGGALNRDLAKSMIRDLPKEYSRISSV